MNVFWLWYLCIDILTLWLCSNFLIFTLVILKGGFDPNAVAIASILESSTPSINGKDYYNISILTRTADGDEGGKHQIIAATVSGGKLYVCKAQAGDKKFVEGAVNSFSVA